MNKIKFSWLLIGAGVTCATIASPILTSCSCKYNSTSNYSSLWKVSNNNCIYIENSNFTDNLNNIEIKDKDNNPINFNKQTSSIKNNGIYLSLNENHNNLDYVKVINTSNNDSIVLTDSNIKTFNNINLADDQKIFFDWIKDTCNNNIPTIGFIRNAALTYQQAFYIALINYFYNVQSNNLNDSSYWFAWDHLWTQNKINFNALIENNVWNGNYEFSSNNIAKNNFNLYKNIDIYDNVNQIIETFTTIMEKHNVDKFDFVTDEIQFMNMFRNNKSKFFNFIFKHANKIIILSDGAYHTNTTVPYLISQYQNHKIKSREQIIDMYNEFLKGNRSLTQNCVLDLLLLKNYEQNNNNNSKFNFVQFINYDSNIFNSINLNDVYRWNESSFSTNFVDYGKNILTNTNSIQKYLDVYTKLFFNVDLSLNNLFVSGQSEYDPNKKNAIFLGSSLFKPLKGNVSENNFSRLDIMPDVLNEVQNTITTILTKYPPNEYNIIFKLHPVFSNADDPQCLGAINYVKQITNNAITNPIIVNSSIPLETWIAYDYYNYTNNSGQSVIFKSNKPEEWSTFFGLQATTTTIQTTRQFYQSTFGIDKYKVAQLIPFSNFPIPKLFPIIDRLTKNNSTHDYSNANLQDVENIYKPYCPSITFGMDNLEDYDSIILNF